MSQPTLSQASMSLGDDPDKVVFDVQNGQSVITLGTALALNLDGSNEETVAKLVEVAEKALTVIRLRTLEAVS